MRYFILCFVLATILSCSQNDSKQQETELTEKIPGLNEKDSSNTAVKADTVKSGPGRDTIAQPLILSPLKVDGDIGRITFSREGKTVFYYDARSKTGKINLNGADHILTKMERGYTLSGNEVNITTSGGEWEEMVSDCAYGKSLRVTITMGGQILQLNDVEVQDCSGMVE